MRRSIAPILIGMFLFMLAVRVLGPSDIYDNHQTRTTSYTVDMLEHGRWFMPRDPTGMFARKPIAYNWASVPFVALFGYREWALKMPSMLAAAVTMGLIVVAARPMFSAKKLDALSSIDDAAKWADAPLLAAMLWIAHSVTFKLAYTARADMLLVMFMTLGWLCATRALEEKSAENKHQKWWVLGMWLAAAGAGLTKGPLGLLVPGYALLAAKFIHGKWSAFNRTGWWWGVPLMFALVACWLVPAYLTEPAFFKEMLIDKEVERSTRGGGLKLLTSAWQVEFYFTTRFFPWSIAAIATFFLIPWRQWRRHPLAPALLWVLLILGVFTCITTKRSDRFAPVYPGASVLAIYAIFWLRSVNAHAFVRWILDRCAWGVVVCCVFLAIHNQWFSSQGRTQFGEHSKTFVAQISKIAGSEKIVFFGVGDTPLQTLLGINQAGAPTSQEIEQAAWFVRPYDGDDSFVVLSELIPDVRPVKEGVTMRVALYRNTPEQRARLPKYNDVWTPD